MAKPFPSPLSFSWPARPNSPLPPLLTLGLAQPATPPPSPSLSRRQMGPIRKLHPPPLQPHPPTLFAHSRTAGRAPAPTFSISPAPRLFGRAPEPMPHPLPIPLSPRLSPRLRAHSNCSEERRWRPPRSTRRTEPSSPFPSR